MGGRSGLQDPVSDPGYQIPRSWLPELGYQIPASRSWLPDRGYQIRDTQSWLPRSWLLDADCCWMPWAAAGCSGLLLAAPGCSWLLLAALGCSRLLWLILAVTSCSWLLLAAARKNIFLRRPPLLWAASGWSGPPWADPNFYTMAKDYPTCFSFRKLTSGNTALPLSHVDSWVGELQERLLETRSRLSDPGHKILASRSWLLDPGYQIWDTRSDIPDLRYHIPSYQILATRSWLPDPGSPRLVETNPD